MTGRDLESILREAIEVVERANVPEDLRPVAFDKALEHITREHVPAGGVSGEGAAAKERKKDESPGDPLDRIADAFGVTRDQVEEIYEVVNDELRLIVAPGRLDASNRAGTEQIALLIVAGRQAAGIGESTDSRLIKSVADDYGKADSNFGKTITAMSEHFSLADKKGPNRPIRARRSAFGTVGELVKSLMA